MEDGLGSVEHQGPLREWQNQTGSSAAQPHFPRSLILRDLGSSTGERGGGSRGGGVLG